MSIRDEQRAQREVETLTHPNRDENLPLRVVTQPVTERERIRDRVAQTGQSAVPGVGRAPPLQSVDRRLAHAPGGSKVRLADAEGNDVVHAGNDVEKLPDAGGRNGLDGP